MVAFKRRAPQRSTRQTVSYKDSDSEESDDSDAFLPELTMLEPAKKRVATRSKKRTDLANPKKVQETQRNSKASKSTKQAAKETTVRTRRLVPSDGVVPNWSSLPYEILLTIFRYASSPLRDDLFNATAQTSWPLQTAHVCKAFCEPALTAFYECPPLLNPLQPRGLLHLLSQDPNNTTINYRAKVRKIELDARSTLGYAAPGRGVLNLDSLLPQLPNLSSVNITDETDYAPFTYRSLRPRYMYADGFFRSFPFPENRRRLKAFRINGNFLRFNDTRKPPIIPDEGANYYTHPLAFIASSFPWLQVLSEPVFNDLRFLALSNLDFDLKHKSLGAALSQLSSLESLRVTSCQSSDWSLLSNIPKSLQDLDIQNCNMLKSAVLSVYLAEHGRDLHTLVLSHNKALDLAFLPSLKSACPSLRELTIDFTYYSTLTMSKDTDPTFEFLLDAQNIPTWPSTLEKVELLHLRKFPNSDAAETLFGSLIESAENLPYLRILILKAAIDIGWRDRAGFRETWISRLQKTFLRKSQDPSPYLASGRAYREWRVKVDDENQRERVINSPEASIETSRRSRRIKDIATDSRRASQEQSVASAEESGSDVQVIPRKDWKQMAANHYQGLCSVVDVTIDNMRPSEVQFDEGDFMDSEKSGDEDWNGDVDDGQPESSRRYAW